MEYTGKVMHPVGRLYRQQNYSTNPNIPYIHVSDTTFLCYKKISASLWKLFSAKDQYLIKILENIFKSSNKRNGST
ncbi:hypothetical protein SAMN05421857_3032 [Chryseobacterium formosense]|nr:hypothetical protein SAMN05421857_3032 [Chryseobacterium formosense]